MVEKQIKDHAQHLKELLGKAMTNKPDYIKELIDYIVLSHSSGYVFCYFYLSLATLLYLRHGFAQGTGCT